MSKSSLSKLVRVEALLLTTYLCLHAPQGQVGPERDKRKIQQEYFWTSFVGRWDLAGVDENSVANGPFV